MANSYPYGVQDHGKSTLADRLLEVWKLCIFTHPLSHFGQLTGTIDTGRQANKQVLDKLKVERERGITGVQL